MGNFLQAEVQMLIRFLFSCLAFCRFFLLGAWFKVLVKGSVSAMLGHF